MIIETRFRDIAFEEIVNCHPDATLDRWQMARGKPVMIEVPGMSAATWEDAPCAGPYFKSNWVRPDGVRALVCPHIAEIGD